MTRTCALLFLSTCFVSACVSPEPSSAPEPSWASDLSFAEESEATEATDSGDAFPVTELAAASVEAVVEESAPAPATPASTSAPESRRKWSSAPELALWSDPAFKQWVVASYASETEIEPRITMDEREEMLEVIELISEDEIPKAVAKLGENLGKARSAVFDFTLANIYYQQDLFDQAAAGYRVAVKKHPKFRRAWQMLGQIHVRQGEFEAAVPELTRVIELGGGDAVTYGVLGFAYSNIGNHISAESAYRMATLLDPKAMDWKQGLAFSFFEQQRFTDAVALCDILIGEYPERAELWLLQANAYLRLNETLRAAENYEFVDRLGASTPDSLANLGDIYVNEELFDMAVDAHLRAMDLDPEGSKARPLAAAKALAGNEALAEARELVEGIELRAGEDLGLEERKDLLEVRARLAFEQDAGEEEVRILEQIVALDPLDADAILLLGQRAGRKGDPEKAIFYFERAANIEGHEAEAKLGQAQLLVRLERYAEALPLLRRVQALEPRDNVAQYLEEVEARAKNR